ncbi:MAG: hypothetical protein AAF170_04615 [Bacteroidota bacterium]
MHRLLLLGLATALASSAQPQTAGSCTTGTAQQFIENPDLRVSLFNTGSLFFGGSTTSADGYRIPKGQTVQTQFGERPLSPIFAAVLWLGGEVGGEMRIAAARYGGHDFWPGPLNDAATPPPQDCSAHDRIFVVSREDIAHYYATGELAPDLADWPHQLGAPVIDGDGNPTNYDLRAGDQPDLIGDVAAWWVMNDAGNNHNPGLPLGVEVRAQAFVYGWTPETRSPVLSQTTFIRYEVINRGDSVIEPMYASMFVDPDLGDAGDDYIGADTLRNMGVVYNDSNGDRIYGSPPPAIGIQVLRGPIGLANGRDDDQDGVVDEADERLRMTATSTFIGGGPSGTEDPGTPDRYYNFMQGLWGDGTPYYEFGTGYLQSASGAPITKFIYAGDPVTESYFSEVNVDGNGTDNPQGDRRMAISTGPFRLEPGASDTLLYAFPFGQGSSHLQSVAVLQGRAAALQRLTAEGFFASRPVDASALGPAFELALSRVRPNPSRQPEALLTLPEATPVRATVLDALGRQLEVVVDGELAEGESVLTLPRELAPGTYRLRVEVPGATETLSFTVMR